jgi:hypothetical protein
MPLRRVSPGQKLGWLRDKRQHYLRELAARQMLRLRTTRDRMRIERLVRAGKQVPHELRDLQLTDNFAQAAARYRPAPWPGKVLLFRAESIAYVFSGGGPCYGWDAVAQGGVETVRVPGNHDTVLLGSNVRVLMVTLNAALEAASQRPAASQDLAVTSPMAREGIA